MFMPGQDKYKEKRAFEHTPEPKGEVKKTPVTEKNRYVIQRHQARREHYDFRIQIEDTLVSWAIPKKPLHDARVKRLAIKVEDHPLDYYHFEGVIPEGNYGAGTVMVWDEGYYYMDSDKTYPEPEEMHKRIADGTLKVFLLGAKMKGLFNLVRSKETDKEEWLFMKAKNQVSEKNLEEKSILTGRSMDEIASEKPAEFNNEQQKESNNHIFANKAGFPGFIVPMFARLIDKPFTDSSWIFELKLDGYRVVSAKNKDNITLYSRRGNKYNEKYPHITEKLSQLNADFVVDGEVCYIDDEGNADFQKLQSNENAQKRIHYYIFDVLWLNGYDLTKIPLAERKKVLGKLLQHSPEHLHNVQYSRETGEKMYEQVNEKGLEGVMAKRTDSYYHPSERSREWLKIKTLRRQEMIVCGYTVSDKSRRYFSSLLCGVYKNNELVFTGKVGTGFDEIEQKNIHDQLNGIERKKPPVVNPPDDKNIRWTKPEMIIEVKFAGWTNENIMRQPRFIGVRTDKAPKEVKFMEQPTGADDNHKTKQEKLNLKQASSNSKVNFTNRDKVFWPSEGITKGDVIDYYNTIADVMLPYLKDRPQSLYRTPEGIKEEGFFQKNVEDLAPDWVKTKRRRDSKGKTIEYLVCQDKDTLLYLANLGCVVINTWNATIQDLEHPDYMVFDLDPQEVPFKKLSEVALGFRDIFEKIGISGYCKTSGSRGLHIYVPVKPKYSYEQVQHAVKLFQKHVHKQFKEITSFERSPSKRHGKVYLDYLQNGRGKTMAAPYSLRAKPGVNVSAPVRWDELKHGISPDDFTIYNMPARIKQEGDIWENMLENQIDLKKITNDRLKGH